MLFKRVVASLLAMTIVMSPMVVNAEPMSEDITSENSARSKFAMNQDTENTTKNKEDKRVDKSEEDTVIDISIEPSDEDKKEMEEKEKQIANMIVEELKLHNEDYDEKKLGDVYFNCYKNETDYALVTYDGEIYPFYVRITPNGEYNLSMVKTSKNVVSRFATMMTDQNLHATETFWNKVKLVNPGGIFTFQAVDWPVGVYNGQNATVITPDVALDNLIYTYEKWDRNWTGGTRQKRLHDQYEQFDDEGFGIIGNRYVIACTLTFGNVGDVVDFYMSNGTVFKTVIGDIKSQHDPGCTKWGHKNGKNVIEFIVNSKIWYNTGHSNPGNPSCHPEWSGLSLVKAVNYGSIWGNEA